MALPFSLSIGDVMLLSSLAWKIGRAFTSGRAGAPSEFREVENELSGLNTAIDLLAESIDADDSILASADDKTKDGLDKILGCCRQTLENLESLVDRYQEIRTPEAAGGATQRTWKTSFVRNYKKMWWTSEGGNIEALRSMLQMHVSSISLTMKALQSKSLARLESTIEPMAKKVDGIHDTVIGSMDVRIAEMHNMMMTMASPASSPRMGPQRQDTSLSMAETMVMEPNRNGKYEESTLDLVPESMESNRVSDQSTDAFKFSDRSTDTLKYTAYSKGNPKYTDPHTDTLKYTDEDVDTLKHSDRDMETLKYPDTFGHLDSSLQIPELGASDFSPTSSPEMSNGRDTRWSDLMAVDHSPYKPSHGNEVPLAPVGSRWSGDSDEVSNYAVDPLHTSYSHNRNPSSPSLRLTPLTPVLLPSPSIDPEGKISSYSRTEDRHPRLPSSHYDRPPSFERPLSSERMNDHVTVLEQGNEDERTFRKVSTVSQQEHLEAMIFNDAATLCEARGTLVEYTQPNNEKPGEWRMVEATTKCKISIVTKRQKGQRGETRYMTSIWSIGDDRRVRLEQILADGEEIIPYTVWGNTIKVVLRVPTELKYHGIDIQDNPLEVARTSWINYVFENEDESTLFQNALMGKRLILSMQTKRTLRSHDSMVTNAFAFQEQLCGLENIRLWSEEDGDGSVLAMIQYSASFRDGYLAFRLHGPYTTVQVKDDGDKWIRIKGLAISLDTPGTDKKALRQSKSSAVGNRTPDGAKSPKVKSEKKITAVKIEFQSMPDKQAFLDKFKAVKGPFFRS